MAPAVGNRKVGASAGNGSWNRVLWHCKGSPLQRLQGDLLPMHNSMPVLGVSWLLQYLLLFLFFYDVLESLNLLPVEIREV